MRPLFRNPFFYLLIAIYAASARAIAAAQNKYAGDAVAALLLFGLLAGLIAVLARRVPAARIEIGEPRREALLAAAWFVLWLGVNLLAFPHWRGHAWVTNVVSFWGLLVVAPAAFLLIRGYRWRDLGLSIEWLRANVAVTLAVAVVLALILLPLTPGGRVILSGQASAPRFLLALGLAFLLAGFHEEFFFRAVLQTRLARALGSELSGLFLATLIFSLYHLPFRLYRGPWEGQVWTALAACFTDPVFGGLVAGVLWMRTRNLLAPVFIHSLIDALSLLPRLK